MTARVLLVTLIVLGVGATSCAHAAGLPGDQKISNDRRASDLSALGDLLVWSHQVSKRRHLLRLYRAGRVERVPVPASDDPMDPDLGLGSDGQPALVYRSCRPRCDLFTYALGLKRERRIRLTHGRNCDSYSPSIWGATVVYSVSGCGSSKEGVWARTGGRSRLLVASDAGQTDIQGDQVAWTHFGDLINRVRVTRLAPNAPILSVFADGQRCCGFNVIISSPSFDGDFLYWGDWNDRARPNDPHRLYRTSVSGRTPCAASDVHFPRSPFKTGGLPWIDFAVSQGRVFYAARGGVFQRPATNFATGFSKYPAASATAPFCGP